MHPMTHFFQTYGYWVMLFGSLIEGETFLVAGGVAAHQGYFSVPILIGMAFVGSCIHDFFFFFLGRFAGDHLLSKMKRYREKSARVLALFDRYGVLIILGLRFAYGLRTIIPTVIGMSPISKRKFMIFDMIGGIIWSTFFVMAGYFFGAALHAFLADVSTFEIWIYRILAIFVFTALIGLLAWWIFIKYIKKQTTTGSGLKK